MAAAKSRKERILSTNIPQSGFAGCPAAKACTGSPAMPPAADACSTASPPESPTILEPATPHTSPLPTILNLNPAPLVTRPPADKAPSSPSSPSPATATTTPIGSPPPPLRRESKAARALQQFGAACRRISEVGLSAVTSAAASWVLPAASRSRRRSSAFWPADHPVDPNDPEAALSPPSSDLGSLGSTVGRDGDSAGTTPRKLATPAVKEPPPGARRFGSASHYHYHSAPPQPPPQGASDMASAATTALSAGDSPTIYGSFRPSSTAICSSRYFGGGGGSSGPSGTSRRGSCSGPLPMLPPSVLALTMAPPAADATDSSAPLSPTHRPGGPGPAAAVAAPQGGDGAAAAAAAAAATAGGFFRQRVTPADGLLFLAPCARGSMWSPARGTKWSLAQYELHRRLYRGYASTVYKATCVTSTTEVVLKVYSLAILTDFLRHQVLRELDIHSRLKHPGVVQLLAAFREGDMLVMVLEYVRGGSLEQVRQRLGGRMGEPWALQLVVLPLLRVLSHLHRLGVVHRDIKPENILFTPDWRLKLCDFGVSIYLQEERAVTRAGSSDYMAPEVNACPLKRTPADNKFNGQLAYGAACDVWSLGAVVYELLVGFTPFPGGPPPGGGAAACRGSEVPADQPAEGRRPGGDKVPPPLVASEAATAIETTAGAAVGWSAAVEDAAEAGANEAGGAAEARADTGPGPAPDGTAAEVETEREVGEPAEAPAVQHLAAALPPSLPSSSSATAAGTSRCSSSMSPSSSSGCPPSSTSTSLAFPARLSPTGRSFLLACLESHATDRPTTEELMQHAWVLGAQQGPPLGDGGGGVAATPNPDT